MARKPARPSDAQAMSASGMKGQAAVWGIEKVQEIVIAPGVERPISIKIRLRPQSFAQAFLRYPNRVDLFWIVKDEHGRWLLDPRFAAGSNRKIELK